MKAVQVARTGGPEVLELREVPDPVARPGEVIVEVRAAGVNFADLMARMGLYPESPPVPFVPGYEVSGLANGLPVIAITRFKGYATRVAVRTEFVIPLPDGLNFEEGAALPVNYLTAWAALVKMSRVAHGDRVLIEHAAGGVGLAAIQIARRAGAEIFGVVGSEHKAVFLRTQGVTPVLREGAWPDRLDIILDPTGPGGLKRDLKLLAPSGRIVLFGASEFVTGPTPRRLQAAWKYLTRPKIDPVRLLNGNRGIYGLNLLTYWGEAADLKEPIAALLDGVREGWLRPRIDRIFPLAEAAAAHTRLHERRNIGKVVLTV